MLKLKNSLIISGTGQNVGKTTLICSIIKQNSDKHIIAVKISPHFHKLNNNEIIISKSKNFVIVKEENKTRNKDSSKMLLAGASEVYYVQCTDKYLTQALNIIIDAVPKNSNYIFESGGVRNIINPDLFIMIKSSDYNNERPSVNKNLEIADLTINFENNSHNFDYKNILLAKSGWRL